jgi:hypothetical protein
MKHRKQVGPCAQRVIAFVRWEYIETSKLVTETNVVMDSKRVNSERPQTQRLQPIHLENQQVEEGTEMACQLLSRASEI